MPDHILRIGNRANRMRGVYLALLLAILAGGPKVAPAQSAHHPVELSLFHPWSLVHDPDASANLRLSLVQGRLATVRGLDLNLMVGMLHRDLRGLQLTGLYSQINGEARGILLTGGVSYVRGEGRGLQWSGLVNFNRERFRGVQFSGVLTYTQEGFSGLQLSSLFNLSDADSRWVQLSSITNVVSGSYRGVQLAGFFNFVVGEVQGVQMAGMNAASSFRGVQAGLANLSGTTKGLQIGAVNYSRERNESIPLGFVNLADNGSVDLIVYGSSFGLANVGVRTIVNRWISTISAGGYHVPDDRTNVGFLSWHYGYMFPVQERISFGIDGGFVHVMPEKSSDPEINDDLRFALQGRLIGEIRTSRKLAFFAGLGLSVEWATYSMGAESSTDPLFVGGISLF